MIKGIQLKYKVFDMVQYFVNIHREYILFVFH